MSVLALLLLPLSPDGIGAQAAPEQTATRQSPATKAELEQGREDRVRRVIVLIPPRLETTTLQTQHGAEQAAAKILSARKPRRKRRRRLFTLPGASRESAPSGSVVPAPRFEKTDGAKRERDEKTTEKITEIVAGKTAEKTGRNVRNRTGGAAKSGGKTTVAGSAAGNAKSKPPDTVPVAQRAALAQALFADMVAERIQERLGVGVAAQTEVSAALDALHLTPADIEDRSKPENGRRLCAALRCQAILIPQVIRCEVKDGLTRDVTFFARVTVEKIDKVAGKVAEKPAQKPLAGAAQKSETNGAEKLEPEGVSAAQWPARFDVAGAASASQVLFHQQYQKPQGDLIRDAAQQAATLLVHALRTGEQAPWMRPADRLAIAPVVAPTQADKLVFTKTGRRVQPSAARGLDGNVSDLFTPDLLPLSPDRIIDASEILARIGIAPKPTGSAQGKNAANFGNAGNLGIFGNLWNNGTNGTNGTNGKNEMQPGTERIQSLGRRLGVDYVLVARITDIEISEGAADPATLVSNTTQGEPERAVRVEAAAALVRVVDGATLWQDRATSTTTAPLMAQSAAGSASAERSLVHDATRFALIEMQRRLRHYRAGFEK